MPEESLGRDTGAPNGPVWQPDAGAGFRLDLVKIRARTTRDVPTPGAVPGVGVAPLVDRVARRVRYLRVSLTDRCNYRCTYCMPAGPGVAYGPRAELLTLEEIGQVCAAFVRHGVERIRLTGGEPLLRRGLAGLVRELSAQQGPGGPTEVVMTTNGELLAGAAQSLQRAGLAEVTVSLDSLDQGRFRNLTRRGHLAAVCEGIRAALDAGFATVKLNTVAIAGFNDDELGAIAQFAWSQGVIPRFIELMPMAQGELFVPGTLMSSAQVRGAICDQLALRLEPEVVGAAPRGPARYWRVSRGPFIGHRLGTIGAMTENFCDGCNRLRLSATGQLHGCLAHDDAGDLRTALRTGGPDRVDAVIRTVLGTKRDGHGFNLDGTGGPNKAMISIGG